MEAEPAQEPAGQPSTVPAVAEASTEPIKEAEEQQEAGADNPTEHAAQEKGNPARKRKVAVFLAYVGHGYQGMQRNPGARTIEDELFRALHAAGAISDVNNDEHGYLKTHWMRAARTDKGVSAVGQVVSLKMVLEPPGMLQRINDALPEQVRVFGFNRATNGFDSRKHCDKRRYEYILPEWAFDSRINRGREQRATAAAEGAAFAGGEIAGASLSPPQQDEQQQRQQQEQEGRPPQQDGQPQASKQEENREVQQEPQADLDQQAAAPAASPKAAQVAAEGVDKTEADVAGAGQSSAAAGGGAASSDAAAMVPASATAEPAAEPGPSSEPAAAPPPAAGTTAGAGTPAAAATAKPVAVPVPVPVLDPGEPFVFTEAHAQRLTQILANFEGTHNFHNYTVRKEASAPDAKRYILSFSCPGVIEINGQRWVKMVVVGQSFMLHQIRKLVGMAVAVMRGDAPESCLALALNTTADLNTPMAPELGLFLDECYYSAYNKQWGDLHCALQQADFQQQVDEFKYKRLYPHIAERDAAEGVNATWLKTLNEANYRFSEWEQQAARRLQQGGSRRPPPKGAGTASLVGSMESYGQGDKHKRQLGDPSDGGDNDGAGDDRSKRQCKPSFGGLEGRVLPPPHLRGPSGRGSGSGRVWGGRGGGRGRGRR